MAAVSNARSVMTEPPADRIIAIDVLLEPGPAMVTKAEAVNAKLRELSPGIFARARASAQHLLAASLRTRKRFADDRVGRRQSRGCREATRVGTHGNRHRERNPALRRHYHHLTWLS